MSYRDPIEAARARRDAITQRLGALGEHDPERAGLESELARVQATIEESRRKLALRVLEDVRVATPCPASWEWMTGDDRVRHCALCEKNVYDLAGLTAVEAVHLLVTSEGNVCVRLHRRRDGRVMTADCLVGRARRRRRVLGAAGALALGAALTARAALPAPLSPCWPGKDTSAFQLADQAHFPSPMSLLPQDDPEAYEYLMGMAVPIRPDSEGADDALGTLSADDLREPPTD